jgi:2-desacetyl-2-hydroxyethyl bacteriochlorophyllide A dehydrogenase
VKTTALVFTGVKQVAVLPVEIPEPGAGEVLLEALYTLISPGTELRCRAGQQAGVQFPFIPGYSFVGRVIGRGPGANLPDGIVVYCGGTMHAAIDRAWGGHIAHAVHSESDVYPLPPPVDPLHGTAAR